MSNKALPITGMDGDKILETMRSLRADDIDWEDGKAWSLVFHPGADLSAFLKEAYTTYFSENALNPSAFPSLKRMETEVVAMTANLLNGDSDVQGNMTSGGTESILMAVKSAREWGKENKRFMSEPEMVIPTSAHPAFEKAAHYFNVKVVHVPVGKDYRADVKATRRAINRNTVLIVGSAPQYPQGVVDPIGELASLARRKNVLMHVDACVGGMMLPFVRALGYDVPPFDFAVPGVTSMSVDLHKYGYAAKGASCVLYRNAELRKHQYFAYTDWPGGIYASPTMTGTRPGGAIAAAWAIFNRLGHNGYMKIAREVMLASIRLRQGIDAIDGVRILGEPHMSVMGIGGVNTDVYEVGDLMQERGWHLDRQQNPNSLHLTINQAHIASHEEFLRDLRECVAECRREPLDYALHQAKFTATRVATRVIPDVILSPVMKAASGALGVGDGELPTRSAAMYGLMASLPNSGDLETMVIDILDKMTRYNPENEIHMERDDA